VGKCGARDGIEINAAAPGTLSWNDRGATIVDRAHAQVDVPPSSSAS
jgi:hypothetical protein